MSFSLQKVWDHGEVFSRPVYGFSRNCRNYSCLVAQVRIAGCRSSQLLARLDAPQLLFELAELLVGLLELDPDPLALADLGVAGGL